MRRPLSPAALAALTPLPRAFYQRDTVSVARSLLGKVLIREFSEGTAALRIDEVEAYLGVADPAAHTFGGRRTRRNETMWGEAGHLYVYFVYGMHYCCNVVTRDPGIPEAILLRGGVAVLGEPLLVARRRGRSGVELANGPGKLCAAMGIDRQFDGTDLATPDGLWIADDGVRVPPGAVVSGPRIGVAYAGEAASWPLRFTVSAQRRAAATPSPDRRARDTRR